MYLGHLWKSEEAAPCHPKDPWCEAHDASLPLWSCFGCVQEVVDIAHLIAGEVAGWLRQACGSKRSVLSCVPDQSAVER